MITHSLESKDISDIATRGVSVGVWGFRVLVIIALIVFSEVLMYGLFKELKKSEGFRKKFMKISSFCCCCKKKKIDKTSNSTNISLT